VYIPSVIDGEYINKDWLELCEVLGIKIINGTSHSVDSIEHLELMAVVSKYAADYNKLVLENYYNGDLHRKHKELAEEIKRKAENWLEKLNQ